MTRGCVEGQLTVTGLKQRLGVPAKRKAFLKDLLIEASNKRLITTEEFNLTVPKQESVVKCYLYSVITNTDYRNKIEEYVLAASQLYTRGSYIANLLALKYFGDIGHGEGLVPKFASNMGVTKRLFDLMETENSLFKQVFCPERWSKEPVRCATDNTKFRSGELRLEMIQEILDEHQVLLDNLRPNWKGVMSASGWDNSINRMYSKYRANIQVSLTNHIPKLLGKYMDKVELADDRFRHVLKSLIQRPLRPMILHNDDFDHIMFLRDLLGCEIDDYMPNKIKYTDKIFDFAIGLKKLGVDQGTYLPVCDLGRKYCYMDMKIASSMFGLKATKDKTFAEFFQLTKADFKARRSKLRRELRKKARRNKVKKKLKARWENLGIGSIKDGTQISSFETDGVGMSIVLKKPVNIFAAPPVPKSELPPMDDPVFIAIDTGRAKAFTAAVSIKGYKKPTYQMLTRKKYYFDMKHKIRMRWEQSRQVATQVNQLLSLHPKSTDLLGYLEVVRVNIQAIKEEFLIDKGRALWRMRLYRLKTKSLDKAVQKLYDAANGRPIVFGIGDANFASSGRGEKSMPTTHLIKVFKKGMNRYIHRNNQVWDNHVRFEIIDEYNTTQKCSRSGEQTTVPMTSQNVRSRRLRFSAYCQEKNERGLRDRDIQAAENMLWCTQAVYYGYERPSYLIRPKRS